MIGQTIAHYKVTAKLGAGGMGEVYRATDTKLGREVALKVLPEAFAQDAHRMARFQREAQVLASLNHPHIAAIYGLEESGAGFAPAAKGGPTAAAASRILALAMELVEGPTLAERISAQAGKPVPLEEALPIARQIAEGLEYAHDKGVIHRDLKPANIKLTPDGKVKVLDFGLAKALSEDSASADISASPTLSIAATKAGVILGTAAYMSPEQAKGKAADRRADVWAFGCVLFEMLTGKQAFAGDTATEVLAEVLRAEPAWSALPVQTPASVRRLLRRALQKDPQRRLHSIADARLELDDASLDEAPAPAAVPTAGSRLGTLVPWTVAALSLAGLAAALLLGGPKQEPAEVTRFTFAENLSLFFARSLAISPDGKRLAYIHETGGLAEVYVRGLDEFTARPLRGATLAREPFFSADGQSLGFVASDLKMHKYSFTDGTVSLVCDCGANSASWGDGNRIVFSTVRRLAEVSGDGGEPRELAAIDAAKGEVAFYSPWMLPGGRTALFTSVTRGNTSDTTQTRLTIEAISLGDKQRKTVLENAASAMYSTTGHLLFYRDGAMLAAPFDAQRVEVTGPAVRVLESVAAGGGDGSMKAALSRNGVLMYAKPEASQLVWVSRTGEASTLRSEPGTYANPRLSPDGTRMAVAESSSVWVLDLNRQTYSILGIDSYDRSFPMWTRDGERIIYSDENILWKRSDGAGAAEYLLTEPEGRKIPTSLSPDGKELVFMLLGGAASGGDIYVAPLEGERKARPFLNTRAYEGGGQLSPSGKVMAYVSDETGRREVYVTPYPGPGRRLQVSTDGGTHPMWNPKGGELFYRLGTRMMSVKITESQELSASKPQLLFEGPYTYGAGTTIANFAVSHDGQRFAMVRVTPGQHARIHVVVNWFAELNRAMAAAQR